MEDHFNVSLTLLENYVFKLDFGEAGNILSDESPPVGQGEGPSPSELLAAAVANCLSASLLFALRKYKQDTEHLSANVQGELKRQNGRLRIDSLNVNITIGQPADNIEHLDRILSQFEQFCTVTQSVQQGIPVHLEVYDLNQKRLK